MKMHRLIVGVVACAMLCSMNDAFGSSSELFEDDSPAIWDMPAISLGSGMNDHRTSDVRSMLDGMEPNISMDFFSENENRTGWGVYGADLKLGLEKNNAWTVLDVPVDGKVDGSSPAAVWDAGSWIDRVLDVGLTNTSIPFSGFLNTMADDGMDDGFNNVYANNIVAIPEPATYGLITIFGGSILLFRRRFKV